MEEEKQIENPFNIGEQVDCKDTVDKWLNAEIIAKQGLKVKVHYTQWSQKYDEWISMYDNRVLKQWELGKQIYINNRIDVKYEDQKFSIWLEAIVLQIDQQCQNKIFVHFIDYMRKYDQWVDIEDKNKVAEVGTYSKAHGKASFKKSNPKYQELQKNFIQMLKGREQGFRDALKNEHNWEIYEVEGDGNCLFRSVSRQIYGVEDHHQQIRQYCMDYIQINKDYFKNFLIGGDRNFEDYVSWKRQDAVWGDNVEIQALREIYQRPIEIYAYSHTPMRTFSEKSVHNNLAPIRLSYHGKSHYNSIELVVNQQQNTNENPVEGPLSEQVQTAAVPFYNQNNGQTIEFGIIEKKAIEEAHERAQKERENEDKKEDVVGQFYGEIAQARKDFEKIGMWDIDQAIQESLNQFNEKKREQENDQLEIAFTKDAINQVEQMIDLETKEKIQQSRQEYEEEQVRLAQLQSKKDQEEREAKFIQESSYQEQIQKATLQSTQEYDDQINKVIMASLNEFNNQSSNKHNTYEQGQQCVKKDYEQAYLNSQISQSNKVKNNSQSQNNFFQLYGDPMDNSTILQVLNNDLNLDISLKEAIQAYEQYGENPQEILAYFCEKKL